MASGWMKAFQCRTNGATEDVYHQQKQQRPPTPKKPATPPYSYPSQNNKNCNNLYSNLGCGDTSHHVKCIAHQTKPKPKKPKSYKPKSFSCSKSYHVPSPPTLSSPPPLQQKERKTRTHKKFSNLSSLPTLVPFPPDHSSRKVVEIIFSSSWFTSPTARTTTRTTFPGDIEMVFKVENPSKMVAVFEEYREKVRSSAGPEDSRCAADGNEMMRFHSAPAIPAGHFCTQPICVKGLNWSVGGDEGIRTFAGSGGAHARVAGRDGGGKRRAMVVCRVIAGRVWTGLKSDLNPVGYESIAVRKGELLVLEPRAVLPCFLIIYNI